MSASKPRVLVDARLIPPGEYCYWVTPIRAGEVLSDDVERYGRDLREFRFRGALKQVLCPHWHRTRHGTVQCRHLQIETLDEQVPDADALALAHFGTAEAMDSAVTGSYLWDEIKACTLNLDQPVEWIIPSDQIPAEVWQAGGAVTEGDK